LLFGNFGAEFFQHALVRIDINITFVAVNRQIVPGFNIVKHAFDFGNNRNIQRFGNNGHVHGRRTVFNNQTADFIIVIIHQIRRPHGLGNDDDVPAVDNLAGPAIIAAEIVLQTVGHIAQVVQTLFEILVIRGRQTVPHVFISALDRRFRS